MLITSPVIGFDLDGVILDHTAAKQRLAKQFGFMVSAALTNSEIMKKMVPHATWLEIQNLLYNDPAHCFTSPVFHGATGTLDCLKQTGEKFFLISLRKNSEVAIAILKHHKLWPNYFNEANTFFVREREDKNTEARRLGVTHFIDDEIGVLEKLIDVPHKFLFDATNAYQTIEDYQRFASWGELNKYLFKDNDKINT